MKYIRNVLAGAIASAAMSGVLSHNRSRIMQLIHIKKRREMIKALNQRYDAELAMLEQQADAEAAAFMREQHDYFVELMTKDNLSERMRRVYLQLMQGHARKTIYLAEVPRITRDYANRLFDLSPKLATVQFSLIKKQYRDAEKNKASLRKGDFPIKALLARINAKYTNG